MEFKEFAALPVNLAGAPWHGMTGVASPGTPQPLAPHAHERREWNATLEKEWRDAESRYKQLSEARGEYFNGVLCEIVKLIEMAGPIAVLHSATKVRELLRPLDPTASAK